MTPSEQSNRVKLCRECRGTGVVGSPEKRVCPVCGGTGDRGLALMSQSAAFDAELFHDGLTTYWVTTQDGLRSANEAVATVATHAGPFRSWITVALVSGRVDDLGKAEGFHFIPDAEGDVECWEVDAE